MEQALTAIEKEAYTEVRAADGESATAAPAPNPAQDQACFNAPERMEQALAAIENAAYTEVRAAVAAADAAPWPQAAAAYTDVQTTGADRWF
jgi:pyruvate dehydrogenase E1 component alpha subunit